jgi:hypothetical protein
MKRYESQKKPNIKKEVCIELCIHGHQNLTCFSLGRTHDSFSLTTGTRYDLFSWRKQEGIWPHLPNTYISTPIEKYVYIYPYREVYKNENTPFPRTVRVAYHGDAGAECLSRAVRVSFNFLCHRKIWAPAPGNNSLFFIH